jgi:single-strand DNA-binding protein
MNLRESSRRATLNLRFVTGNLTKDPEMNYTPNGTAVTKFTVANNEYGGKDAQGNNKETVTFVNVVVWDKRAETCATWLKKGSKVLVVGKHSERPYTSRDGVNKTWIEIIANDVEFIANMKTKDEVHGYIPSDEQPVPDRPLSDDDPF